MFEPILSCICGGAIEAVIIYLVTGSAGLGIITKCTHMHNQHKKRLFEKKKKEHGIEFSCNRVPETNS